VKRSNVIKINDSAYFVVNEADFTVTIAGYNPSVAQQTIISEPGAPIEESQPAERSKEETPSDEGKSET